MQDITGKRERLKDFYLAIKDCKKCSLGSARTNFVFGSGNSSAKIIFIGEAPGKNEDLQGKPFVGQAGRLLDSLLESIGFTRSDVFIANVLKCRPPQNRDPETSEINLCKGYLFEQIEIIDPFIICTMGRYSTQLVLDTTNGINTLRGKVFKSGNRIIIPINHPAAALYTPSRLQLLKDDFARIKKVFEKIEGSQNAAAIQEGTGVEQGFTIYPVASIQDINSESASSNLALKRAAGSSNASPGNNEQQPLQPSANTEIASEKNEEFLQAGATLQEENRQLGLF